MVDFWALTLSKNAAYEIATHGQCPPGECAVSYSSSNQLIYTLDATISPLIFNISANTGEWNHFSYLVNETDFQLFFNKMDLGFNTLNNSYPVRNIILAR